MSVASADEGSLVTFSGTNLDSINGATYNSYTVSVLPGSETQIQARVPFIANVSLVRGVFLFETEDGFTVPSPDFEVIKHPTSISVTPTQATVAVGRVTNVTAQVLPMYATDRSVQWFSSNSTIVAVDAHGTVVARSPGSAVVMATTVDGGLQASAAFTVMASVPVQSVGATITTAKRSVAKGATLSLSATLTPQNAAAAIAWTSSAPSIVSVDSVSGLVSGIAYGSAVVTATPSDGGMPDSITIAVVVALWANDTANTVVGNTTGLEYSFNAGQDWFLFAAKPIGSSQLSGNRRLLARVVGVVHHRTSFHRLVCDDKADFYCAARGDVHFGSCSWIVLVCRLWQLGPRCEHRWQPNGSQRVYVTPVFQN